MLGGQRAQLGTASPSVPALSVCMSHIPSVPLWSQEGRYGIEIEIWAVQPMLAPSVDQSQRLLPEK